MDIVRIGVPRIRQFSRGKKKEQEGNMSRISKDEYYLGIAEAVGKRGTCIRRIYGAVIVKDDEILSTGYNGSPRGVENCCDCGECVRNKLGVPKGERYELCVAVHAEQNAIISALRRDMMGATIYITGVDVETGEYANPKPCLLCERMLKNAGIKNVTGRLSTGEVVKFTL